MIKLWLDDERDPTSKRIQEQFGADGDEVWVKTAREAIAALEAGNVSSISLDHDLGPGDGTGMDVAKWIEENAFNNTLKSLKWYIHSLSAIGRKNMQGALINANKYWTDHNL